MTSNSNLRRSSSGALSLGITAVILAVLLAIYLYNPPTFLRGLLPGSETNANGATELVSRLPEDADSEAVTQNLSASSSTETNQADNEASNAASADSDDEAADDEVADDDASEDNAAKNSDSAGASTDSEEASSSDSNGSSGSDQAIVSDNESSGADAGDRPAPNTIVGTYKGLPVGYTEEGLVFRGNPDAPITIFEYSDYQCPFCLRHFSQTETALNESYVATGQAKMVFVDFPLVQIHPNAPAASAAALCVAEQDPVAYWEMHALIFETQNQWSNVSDPVAFFQDTATQLDIDQEAYASCVNSGRSDAKIEQSYAMGRSLGYSGTPSFQFVVAESGDTYDLVGAQPFEKFSAWLDAFAMGEVPRDALPDGPDGDNQEMPFWATAEGLAEDPEKVGFTMAGDPYRGDLDAPIVVIEYSDYQCPFCRRHTVDTQPLLDEEFVNTGQVRWVFRHFPLNIHPQAPMAGVAAECAGEQGQFWEMHELLFNDVSSWSVSSPNAHFEALAQQLNLNGADFSTCLANESMLTRIDSDFADGRPFVQGTPTFIVLSGGQGRLIPGALPADTFAQALNEIIAEVQ